MKRKLTFLLTLILPVIVMSQAVIVFESKEHNFGKIKEEDGRVSHEFVFTNQGNEPLVINKVQASCGCTTPSWTKTPLEPGEKGSITVIYNPAGRPGMFSKSVSVQSNSTTERERLIIKGEVETKAVSSTAARETLPVVMGGIRLGAHSVHFNNIEKGTVKEQSLKVKNTSDENIKISFLNVPSYISASFPNNVLAPNTESELKFTFDSKKCTKWGPLSDEIYLVLNNKKELSDTYKITLTSNIVEDFSKMTVEQKRNAPILEISERTLKLGVQNAAAKTEGTFLIKNVGEKALEIRSVINTNKEFSFKQEQLSIRGGKTAKLKFNLSPDLKPGKYKRAITLQTNDPENTYVVLSIEWEIKE